MKLQCLLVFLLFILVTDISGDKLRKLKKYRRHRTTTTTTTESDPVADDLTEGGDGEKDMFSILENDEEAEEEKKQKLIEQEEEKKQELTEQEEEKKQKLTGEEEQEARDEPSREIIRDNDVPIHDPCAKKHCGAGRVCELTEEGEAECVCIPTCPEEVDPRRKVCSNHNETWGSDCEVYQMRCWCDRGLDGCRGEKYKHVHIEYYGVCRDMPECTTEQMADFPRRMRDWLFNIMRDLADRQELTPYYLKMEREAETNLTRRWSNAAVWKWCDLDGHPHDNSVSRHELFPIRAPLMALEHCIAPFLDSCDVDDNHRITLKEWGKCLEIEEDDLEEKCDELRND